MLTNFIKRQRFRSKVLISSFTAVIIINIVRGLTEVYYIHPFTNKNIVFAYSSFYTVIYFTFSALITKITGLNKWRALNVAMPALFLALLPPVIDISLNIIFYIPLEKYMFYTKLFTEPLCNDILFFYCPQEGQPLGESITLNLLIVVTSLYVYISTKSIIKSLMGILSSYSVIFFIFILLPSSIVYLNLLINDNMRIPYYFIFVPEFLLASVAWLSLQRKEIITHILKRSVHSLPFASLTFFAAQLNHTNLLSAIIISAVIGFLFIAITVQNDFFDREEDIHNNRKPVINYENMIFFSSISVLIIISFLGSGHSVTGFLAVFLLAGFYYNLPATRGKTKFPLNIKIEGIWAASSFGAGLFAEHTKAQPDLLLWLLLIAGGWSIISNLKDVKDIEGDRQSGVRTIYTIFIKNNRSISYIKYSLICTYLLFFFLLISKFYVNQFIIIISSIAVIANAAVIYIYHKYQKYFTWFLFLNSVIFLLLGVQFL